jgi:transcription elongation GreA/GreB family factor
MPITKPEVTSLCAEMLQQRLLQLKTEWQELEESMANETKSSLGDKHETARARMQAEQERMAQVLNEAEQNFSDFQKIDFTNAHSVVRSGSLVHMQTGSFLIGPALGKLNIASEMVYAISTKSPLGQQLQGLAVGTEITLNGQKRKILSIE